MFSVLLKDVKKIQRSYPDKTYLRLIDITIYVDHFISGAVVEGCHTEALVLRREKEEQRAERNAHFTKV